MSQQQRVILTAGTRNRIIPVYFRQLILAADTESAANQPTDVGKTGLVFNTATLTCYCKRENGSAMAVTLADMTLNVFTSGGFKEIDGTNMKGLYQFCPPNSCLAKGSSFVDFIFQGITGTGEVHLHVDLIRALSVGGGHRNG